MVITVYNLGWCIEDTLRSVFAQTYPNLEIIVVDDASTDDTQARLEPYLDRIKYMRHPKNLGILSQAEAGPARSTGVKAAAGDFVAILDGDDVWEPEKIEFQVEAAARFPHTCLVVCDGVSFDHADGSILQSTLLLDAGDRYLTSLADDSIVATDLYERFVRGCLVDTPSQVMIAKHVFDSVGLFSECASDDYEFYIRASAQFQVAVVKRRLVRYRIHAANLSGSMENQFFRFVQPNLDIWKRHLKSSRPGAEPIIKAQIRKHLMDAAEQASDAGRRGKRNWAFAYLLRLVIRNPGSPAAVYVAYQLMLVCAPQRVASGLGRVTRRARRLLL